MYHSPKLKSSLYSKEQYVSSSKNKSVNQMKNIYQQEMNRRLKSKNIYGSKVKFADKSSSVIGGSKVMYSDGKSVGVNMQSPDGIPLKLGGKN